jgi:hypothetical protein
MATGIYSIVLGVVGAIIGAVVTRTPQGAMIGWTIGSTLGAVGEMVFAGTDTVVTKGPRIFDLAIQTSNYGMDIPKVYGISRFAGNVIWAADLREKRKIRHLDGDAEFWEYNYYANFAIGLCEGEIAGVQRIWMDGKLWLDLRNSLELGTTVTSSIQRGDRYAVYPGSETQTADPTIVSFLGADETTAYRGLAYIVFNDLPVRNYGNRVPEVTVEVIANGVSDNEDWEFSLNHSPLGICLDKNFNLITATNTGGALVRVHDGISSTILSSFNPGIPDDAAYTLRGCMVINDDLWVSWTHQTGSLKGYLRKMKGISAAVDKDYELDTTTWIGDFTYYNNKFIIANGGSGKTVAYKLESGSMNQRWSVAQLDSGSRGLTVDADGNLLECNYNGNEIRKRSGLRGALSATLDVSPSAPSAMYYERNYDVMVVVDSSGEITVYDGFTTTIKQTGRMSTTSLALDVVVSDLCTSIQGLSAGDIDVTDLSTNQVTGYIRTGAMSVRRALEPLMATYQFDAAEIDHKLHFIKRGGANQATITEDEIAAHEDGEEMPDKISYTRSQEQDVPKEFSVVYIDKARDYQEGTARSIRMSLNNDNISKIEFPIVLTPTEAKQLAEIMHNTAYTERVRIAFQTSQKYLYLAPTDPITVDGFKMRINTMAISNGLLQIEGLAESDKNYTSTATSEDPAFNDQDLSNEGPTIYQLLDMPILNDVHDNAGFYISVHGLLSGWVGAQLYIGNTNVPGQVILNPTIMGSTEDVLDDADVAVWDTTNSVTVQLDLTSDTLSTATEAQVYNLTNWAAIGVDGAWEVIAFKTVVDNGGGNYTLSNFIRGLRNTEEFTGGHAINDRFVILDISSITAVNDGNLGRYVMSSGLIGIAQIYKVTSLHDDPQENASFEFTNNALGLKPYAPTDINGSRDGSNNLTITWKRSSRINNGWDDYADVPLGEDSEAYEVDCYDTNDGSFGNVVRTIEITSETASYTATQQTTDGLTPGDLIDVKVYQISATVDRGYGRGATI